MPWTLFFQIVMLLLLLWLIVGSLISMTQSGRRLDKALDSLPRSDDGQILYKGSSDS